jgi:hypothetical protein
LSGGGRERAQGAQRRIALGRQGPMACPVIARAEGAGRERPKANRGRQGRDHSCLALRAGGFRPYRAGRFGGFACLGLQPKLSQGGPTALRVGAGWSGVLRLAGRNAGSETGAPQGGAPSASLSGYPLNSLLYSLISACPVRRLPPAFAPMARFFLCERNASGVSLFCFLIMKRHGRRQKNRPL